jgi:hypothetical protein
MGSLNALEQTGDNCFWKDWITDGILPSADTMGRVFNRIGVDQLRLILKQVYSQLKRNKALHPAFRDHLFAVIIDGHESSASYLRCCPDCLKREIKTVSGSKIQYYHRHVTAVLLCKDLVLLLDLDWKRPRCSFFGSNDAQTANDRQRGRKHFRLDVGDDPTEDTAEYGDVCCDGS